MIKKAVLSSKVMLGTFAFLLVMLFVLSSIVGNTKINGFDIDSEGRLYIGRSHQIEVYKGNKLVNTIPIPNFRNWSFKISNQGHFYISDISTVYEIDESGQIVSEYEDVQSCAYKEMYKRKYIDAGDAQIRKTAPFGWTRIVNEDGDCLYKIPALNYWFMMVSRIATSVFFVSIVVFSIRSHKARIKMKTGDGTS